MHHRSAGRSRKVALFGFGTTAFVLALASTAFACVAFTGKMTVTGQQESTTVVGTGNSHGYCSTGRPTTAAAGTPAVSLTVSPGQCADSGAVADHQLPAGIYEVRYNSVQTYTFDGTYWNMTPFTGCFRAGNEATTSTIGTFEVDAAGNGSWTGVIVPKDPTQVYLAQPGGASNLCIGSEDPNLRTPYPSTGGRPGLLAPYQLLPAPGVPGNGGGDVLI